MDPYLNEILVIHAVEVIAGQDDDVFDVFVLGILQQPQVLANSISSSFEPLLAAMTRSLCGSQNLDVAITEVAPVAKVVRARKMTVQRGRIELRENVDFVDPAIDAVAHRHVDQSVATSQRHLLTQPKTKIFSTEQLWAVIPKQEI